MAIEPDRMTLATSAAMLPAERRQEILLAVRAGTTHVSRLAESFGVSEMTVRRDLRVLARDGKLQRVHGGAVNTRDERPFDEIAVERFDVKDRIGAAAAAMVEDGQTVMVDIGTTTLQLARHLHGRPVTVITTSLAVYEELATDPQIDLVLTGGEVRRNYRSLVGVLAEESLRQLGADVAFIGTSGVDAELSVWDTTMVEVPIKRVMIGAADRVVLLADSEKFGRGAAVRICGPAELDAVITDAGLPAPSRAALDKAGIEATYA